MLSLVLFLLGLPPLRLCEIHAVCCHQLGDAQFLYFLEKKSLQLWTQLRFYPLSKHKTVVQTVKEAQSKVRLLVAYHAVVRDKLLLLLAI